MSDKKLHTTQEMAGILRVSVKTFRKYIKDFGLPFYGSSTNPRFDSDKVLRAMETRGYSIETPETKPTKKTAPDIWTNEGKKFAKELGLNL